MGVRQQQQTGGSVSNVSIGKGIGVGILAWIVTFVLTNLLFVLGIGNSDQGFEYYDRTGWRDLVGYKFGENYFSAYPGAFDGPSGLPGLMPSYDTIPDVVYILIAVGILGLLGYRMVSNATTQFDEVGAAAQGATMAIPYAVLMGLTVLAVGAFMEGDILFLPSDVFSDELTNIVLVGGVIYPAVFGGAGGVAAVFRAKQSAGQQPAGRPPAQGQPPTGGQPRAPPQQPGGSQGNQPPQGQQPGQPQGQTQTGQQPGQPQGQQPGPQGQAQSSRPHGGQPNQSQPQDDQRPSTNDLATEDADGPVEPSDDGDSGRDSGDDSSADSGSPSGSRGSAGSDV